MALGREMSTPPLLQWSMAHFTFSLSKRLYHNNTQKNTNTLGWAECVFCVFSLGLYFVYSFVFLWFVGVSPSFYVSLGSWFISLTVFGVSITNLNEPPRASATSTIAWVRSQLHPYWAVVKKATRVQGVMMSLALHYWMRDVHHCSGSPSPKRRILCRVGR